MEDVLLGWPAHQLQMPITNLPGPLYQLTSMGAVGPDSLQPGEAAQQPTQYQLGSIPILDMGWVHRQKQTEGIDHNMPFTAFHFLACVVPPRPSFSVVFTLWLSIMAPLGLGYRPSLCRTWGTKAS